MTYRHIAAEERALEMPGSFDVVTCMEMLGLITKYRTHCQSVESTHPKIAIFDVKVSNWRHDVAGAFRPIALQGGFNRSSQHIR